MRKFSGLQRDVVALYNRSLLREAAKKDRRASARASNFLIRPADGDYGESTFGITLSKSQLERKNTSAINNARDRFRRDAGVSSRNDFRIIGNTLGKGRQMPHSAEGTTTTSPGAYGNTAAGISSAGKRAMSTASSTTTSSHYEGHSADTYERAYFYEPGEYMQHLVDLTSDALDLDAQLPDADADAGEVPSYRMLDIGGGTGNFAYALIARMKSLRVTVVDPFLDPTSSFGGDDDDDNVESALDFVKASAESFMDTNHSNETTYRWRGAYHKVLLKEVAHHFQPGDRVGIFRGMFEGLTPAPRGDGASLLIITRPQVDVDYPLWDEARLVWKENQPSEDDFCRDLREAGFVHVEHTIKVYPCRIALDRWLSMVKGRFWSTFTNFSDDELNAACRKIEHDYKDRVDENGIIQFEDRLVFISARKDISS